MIVTLVTFVALFYFVKQKLFVVMAVPLVMIAIASSIK